MKMTSIRKTAINLAVLASVLTAAPSFANDNIERIERAGDIVQLLVPAVAYGLTFYHDDEEGRSSFVKAVATNVLVTHGLKNTVRAQRPNGADYKSFPSGHTSAAFQGAGFIHARYGIEAAIPAYAAAAFVGYSRVVSKNHWARDVAAGAAIGVASSFYFTPQKFGKNVSTVAPYISGKQFGLVWSTTLD
jgi:membrane-associated phospholipid phosphatase